MLITVDRFISDTETTISKIDIDGQFACFGLEDQFQFQKVPGETRIPPGEYTIRLRREGSLHKRYGKRFPGFHQGMLHLQDVPNFTYILIHIGNTDKDSDGCLLLGEKTDTTPGRMSVTRSADAYTRFYKSTVGAAKAGTLRIRLIDNDR